MQGRERARDGVGINVRGNIIARCWPERVLEVFVLWHSDFLNGGSIRARVEVKHCQGSQCRLGKHQILVLLPAVVARLVVVHCELGALSRHVDGGANACAASRVATDVLRCGEATLIARATARGRGARHLESSPKRHALAAGKIDLREFAVHETVQIHVIRRVTCGRRQLNIKVQGPHDTSGNGTDVDESNGCGNAG